MMSHPLKDYLDAAADTVTGFAARIGVSRQTLHRILSGAQAPKPIVARRIVAATGGAVEFETLYGESAERLADFESHRAARGRDEETLDPQLLAPVLRLILKTLSVDGPMAPTDALVETAAEATANTHTALAGVTTRRGPARLAQALRPVLAEILKECAAPPIAPDRLDEAAACAGSLYYQALPLHAPR